MWMLASETCHCYTHRLYFPQKHYTEDTNVMHDFLFFLSASVCLSTKGASTGYDTAVVSVCDVIYLQRQPVFTFFTNLYRKQHFVFNCWNIKPLNFPLLVCILFNSLGIHVELTHLKDNTEIINLL